MPKPEFTPYQKLVVGILVSLQFTMVLDFMVMAPLGAVLMPAFAITPREFSVLISSYAISACVSSLLASILADRYDRKSFLVAAYTLFVAGTLGCALAPTYPLLLAARIATGVFGGVIAGLIPTLTADLFPEERRGQVIGFTQISFGLCQAFALPIALSFANRWSWHAPFYLVAALGLALLAVIVARLKPVRAHLLLQDREPRAAQLARILVGRENRLGFAGTLVLTLGGYLLMPFTSAYNVANLGMSLHDLPTFYLVSGSSVILFAPLIGRISDRLGRLRVFTAGALLTGATVLTYVRLTEAGLGTLCLMNVLTFAGFFAMIIPFQSLLTTLPSPQNRGGFLSINASLQQLGGGISVLLAGLIVTRSPEGRLENFGVLGTLLSGTLLVSFFIARRIRPGHNTQAFSGAAIDESPLIGDAQGR